jgi:hypothetical protein
MREESWYKDVEQSLMILHAKIDALKADHEDLSDFVDAIVELNAEEDLNGDSDTSNS